MSNSAGSPARKYFIRQGREADHVLEKNSCQAERLWSVDMYDCMCSVGSYYLSSLCFSVDWANDMTIIMIKYNEHVSKYGVGCCQV